VKSSKSFLIVGVVLVGALVAGQGLAYLLAPDSWHLFFKRLPVILSMVAFWGPIVAVIVSGFVWVVLRLLGFRSLKEIRDESVQQNNPAPAIAFVGALIAAILFLSMVIRP
jgi:hypothetical protein